MLRVCPCPVSSVCTYPAPEWLYLPCALEWAWEGLSRSTHGPPGAPTRTRPSVCPQPRRGRRPTPGTGPVGRVEYEVE